MPARKKIDPAEAATAEEAKARYSKGQPVTLKQLALALEISYEQVRTWRRLPGFPYMPRLIFPEDFKLWRQRRFGLTGRVAARKKERELPKAKKQEKQDTRVFDDIPPNLPERARRLFEQARKR